jgi:hypothetical protein
LIVLKFTGRQRHDLALTAAGKALRSEGTGSGEPAPSGGEVILMKLLKAFWRGSYDRYRYVLGNCNWGTSGGEAGGSRKEVIEALREAFRRSRSASGRPGMDDA